MALALLEKGANVNYANPHGDTALLLAAATAGSKDLIRLLMENGARLDERNRDGEMPIDAAVRLAIQENVTELRRLSNQAP